MTQAELRKLPSVDRLLRHPVLVEAQPVFGRDLVVQACRELLEQVRSDILYAFDKPGFSFIEVLSPCPIGYGKSNQMREGLDEIKVYRERCQVAQDVPLEDLGIDFHRDQPIYVGRFLDRDLKPYQSVKRGAQS